MDDIGRGALRRSHVEVGETERRTANGTPHQAIDAWRSLRLAAAALAPGHATDAGNGRARLLRNADVSPVAMEQYRRMAATLHDLHVDRGLKVLMVTSALPREGKTLTVGNLALTLSESYRRRVLVIDADLRRPCLHTLLGTPNASGLGEVLEGRAHGVPIVHTTETLAVLPAGRPQSMPLADLISPRMQALIDEVAAHYDYVLLDTPPVGLLPDAQLLARMAQGVLFVIRAGVTPYSAVNRAIAELGRDCILGTVLNAVEDDAIPVAGYYSRYYGAESV